MESAQQLTIAGMVIPVKELPSGDVGYCLTDVVRALGLEVSAQYKTLKTKSAFAGAMHQEGDTHMKMRVWLPLFLLLPYLTSIDEGRLQSEDKRTALREAVSNAMQEGRGMVHMALNPASAGDLERVRELQQAMGRKLLKVQNNKERIGTLQTENRQLLADADRLERQLTEFLGGQHVPRIAPPKERKPKALPAAKDDEQRQLGGA